jgi:predicted ATPase
MLAEMFGEAGEPEEGRAILHSIRSSQQTEFYSPEALRIDGELILKSPVPDPLAAERSFSEAMAMARQREDRSFELRAAMSLARLWHRQGRRKQAYDLLSGVYGWFTEGFETADLRSAQALLSELA